MSNSRKECLNCNDPAEERYTLVFDSGKVIEDKLLCDVCVDEFRELDWLEVEKSPVLMRGGDCDDEE